jgi:GMP synthase PP-ATPase subunit
LVNRAIGESLLCVLVDTGYMRKNETENNERLLRKLGLNVLVVDAKKRFTRSQAQLLTVRDILRTLSILGEIEALST